MAVFIQMRKWVGLIVVVISLAIVLFLLMDVTDNNPDALGGGQKSVVGKVNGEKIKFEDFSRLVEEVQADQLLFNPQTIQDAQFSSVSNNQAWELSLYQILMGGEYDKIGIYISAEEITSVMKDPVNPHPLVKQLFANQETGEFDPAQIPVFVSILENPETTPQQKQLWEYLKRELRKDLYDTKYQTLVRKAVYIPVFLAEQEYFDMTNAASINYMLAPFTSVDEASVKIDDGDLKAYIEDHKTLKAFKQDESVKLNYVIWPIEPSGQDSVNAMEQYNKLFAEFAAHKTVTEDSIFAELNNPDGYNYVRMKYISQTEFGMSEVKDTVFEIDTMKAFGPYLENGLIKGVKVLDRKLIADSVQAKHIFIAIRTREEGELRKNFADSLANTISEGTAIDTVFKKLPADLQQQSGMIDWGWIKPGEKPELVNNFLFYEGKQGDVKVCYTGQGFEIVYITSSTPTTEGVRLSYVVVPIEASAETEKNIYTLASEFAATNRTKELFTQAGELMNMRLAETVKPSDATVTGLASSRDLVRWAFEAEAGDISPVLSNGSEYYVALLEKKRDKGMVDLEDVRDLVTAELMKEKKAELLTQKIEDALKTSNDLNSIASACGGSVSSAPNITFTSSQVPAIIDPKIAAAAVALAQGATSKPIVGADGVYVIQSTGFIAAQPQTDFSAYIYQVQTKLKTIADNSLFPIMIEMSNVKDNRIDFY